MIKLANLNLVEKRLLLTFSVELSFNEKFEIQKKRDWRILIFADERDYNRIFHQDQRTLEYPPTVWNVFKAFSAFSYKRFIVLRASCDDWGQIIVFKSLLICWTNVFYRVFLRLFSPPIIWFWNLENSNK